jgi:hypothetical protein
MRWRWLFQVVPPVGAFTSRHLCPKPIVSRVVDEHRSCPEVCAFCVCVCECVCETCRVHRARYPLRLSGGMGWVWGIPATVVGGWVVSR